MKHAAKPRGRPRSFDRAKALERAMQLFWRQGYEATSLNDLTHAMGINPPSLYAAFGDKQQLYLEALERYQQWRRESVASWFAQEPTAKAAVGRLLREAATELARSGGSMLVLSATSCAAASLQSELAQRRAGTRSLIKARIDRGVRAGELPKGTDSAALADFYTTVFQGMSIQAHDGATRRRLLATAEAAMRAWPRAMR